MTIQVLDKTFQRFLSEQQIDDAVSQIAKTIDEKYAGQNPILIPILNGAFMFASDLVKKITIPCEVCFVKLASYKGTKTTNNVVQAIGLETNLLHRPIILVDDILDTGKTIYSFINNDLVHRQPQSIEIAILLHKYEETIHDFENKLVGIRIPNKFVVGYGLDYDGYGRNYKEIYQHVH